MTPELPFGWTAQPIARRDFADGTSYELVNVYDPLGFRDEGQSHWLVTHMHGEMPHPRAVSFAEIKEAGGPRKWREFARQLFERKTIDGWIRRVDDRRRSRDRQGSRISIVQPSSVRV